MAETFNKARRYTRQKAALSTRGVLLFVLPVPLVVAAVVSLARGILSDLLGNVLAIALYLAAALVARRGFKNELAYAQKSVALPPRLPLKLFGGVLIAAATWVAAFTGAGHSFAIATCFGAGALLGYYLAYGFDPRGEKSVKPGFGYSTRDIVEALQQAEIKIQAIESARTKIRNTELSERLQRIVQQSRRILKVIEDDPKDLRRARKFLITYLEGAQNVTEGYAKAHGYGSSSELDENFRNVLVTIEAVFEEQYKRLLEDDILDLDVQIEVLTTQLKREGVI